MSATFVFLIAQAVATVLPPKIFIDPGACPFECCTYREWSVKADTQLFEKIQSKKKIGQAQKGTFVTALTGEVHTVPLKMKEGFYLLTYEGEGFWKIWQNGKVKSEVKKNWKSEQRPQSTWWVQIKLPDGKIGWTQEVKNFGNMDSCGG